MIFTAQRIAQDDMSSLARWFSPDGTQLCYALEPGQMREPHPGIPVGIYDLKLRTVGEKHKQYLKWYGPDFHRGMVEIAGVAGRTAILLHVGNSIADTEGCSLCGERALLPRESASHHYEVTRSRVTYEKIYPIIRDAILAGPVSLIIKPIGTALS